MSTWDDVRKSQHIIVQQHYNAKGPRQAYTVKWAGKVVEHNPKWTVLKYGDSTMSMPLMYKSSGTEEIEILSKKEFDKRMKND